MQVTTSVGKITGKAKHRRHDALPFRVGHDGAQQMVHTRVQMSFHICLNETDSYVLNRTSRNEPNHEIPQTNPIITGLIGCFMMEHL